ncbi:branched-chain amino acid ABC transporter substrate-binding protein [Zavarzinia sp.]|uniref:branched-chain amino acid ABC transporter substrate-binding protein n=1 Tax=Zavarzinia sp. TaxID=2027920 RepID=UPI0035663550
MRKWVLGFVGVMAVCALLAWLLVVYGLHRGGQAPVPVAATPAATAALPDIVFGLAAPLSGPQAGFGAQLKAGVEFAVEAINANGGIEGRKVVLVQRDDGCDADRAKTVAGELVAAKAVAVIGHFCSSASLAAAPVYAAGDVVMITPASTDPRLTMEGAPGAGFVFRTVWRDDFQGLVAAALVKQTLASKKIGVVRDGSLYGQQLTDVFKAALAKLELAAPAADLELGPSLSAKQAAAKLKSAGVGAVFVVATPATAGGLAKALREAGVTASIIGPDALASPDYAKAAGKAADGTIVTFARNPLDYPTAAKAIEKLTERGQDPSGYVLDAFAAAQILSAALGPVVKPDPAGAIDGKRLASTIRVNRFSTVLGELAFDSRGDLTKPGVVYYLWKGGKLNPM